MKTWTEARRKKFMATIKSKAKQKPEGAFPLDAIPDRPSKKTRGPGKGGVTLTLSISQAQRLIRKLLED